MSAHVLFKSDKMRGFLQEHKCYNVKIIMYMHFGDENS